MMEDMSCVSSVICFVSMLNVFISPSVTINY